MRSHLIIGAVLAAGLQSASAATIASLDLSALEFEIDSLTSADSFTGTSNGIGWTYEGANVFLPFSNNTDAQVYNDLPTSHDDLHISGNFTVTFDTAITGLLVALANDNDTGDGPDFGLTPADSKGVTASGTFLSIDDIGGALAFFEFDEPVTQLVHTDAGGLTDGYDFSFFAFTADPVPLPGALPFFAAGLAGLTALRRRRRG